MNRTQSAATGGAAGLAIGSALVAFIAAWEGSSNVAYQDINSIWTVCYGHTDGVKKGDKYTDKECSAMLRSDIAIHRAGVLECVQSPLNQNQLDALTSLAFNLGIAGACNSSPVKLMNEGKYGEACNSFLEYRGAYSRDPFGNRIPGSWREVKGLRNRREAEQLWCLTPSDGPRGAQLFDLLRDSLRAPEP